LLLHLKNVVRNFQVAEDKAAQVVVDKVAVDNAADKGEEHQLHLRQIN
jgi:hypothetical protein